MDETISSGKTQEVTLDPRRPLLHFEPGDIVFMHSNDDKHDIVRGQKFARKFMRGTQEHNIHKTLHVVFYLGDGKIAHSTNPHEKSEAGVQIMDIQDFVTFSDEDTSHFTVCRPKNKSIAENAVQLALSLDLTTPSKKLRYSIPLAINSIFHSSNFGAEAKKRAFLAYARGPENILNDSRGKNRDFFCSYFVGWCLQNGESRKVIDNLLKEYPQIPRPPKTPPEPESKSVEWSKMMAKTYGHLLDEQMQMKFDAKHMTPQKLRSIIIDNPAVFQDVVKIVPKKQPTPYPPA